jgi:hypothetical protein
MTQIRSLGVGTPASGVQGEVRATSSVTSNFSDQRLKTVLGDIPDPLDKIKKIRGVYYRVNNLAQQHGYRDRGMAVGLIAQELQAILPEVVRLAPFDTAANGASITGENYLTVMYSRVVPLLIEALKKQKQQLDYIGHEINQKGIK